MVLDWSDDSNPIVEKIVECYTSNSNALKNVFDEHIQLSRSEVVEKYTFTDENGNYINCQPKLDDIFEDDEILLLTFLCFKPLGIQDIRHKTNNMWTISYWSANDEDAEYLKSICSPEMRKVFNKMNLCGLRYKNDV